MRILMIEDDLDLCNAVKIQIEKEGYQVDLCHDGEDGLYFALQNAHDVILLDRMLPIIDGISLLKKLRNEGIITHIILVTALNGVSDRVDGLDAGADDYIIKPFAISELLARIRAVLRRPIKLSPLNCIELCGMQLDLDKNIIFSKTLSIKLSRREAQLMEFFFKQPDVVLKRERIISAVWGIDAQIEEGNLDSYIHFLRRRLKQINSSASIKTVHGTGYILECNNDKKH